jgi:hypothetical protein
LTYKVREQHGSAITGEARPRSRHIAVTRYEQYVDNDND